MGWISLVYVVLGVGFLAVAGGKELARSRFLERQRARARAELQLKTGGAFRGSARVHVPVAPPTELESWIPRMEQQVTRSFQRAAPGYAMLAIMLGWLTLILFLP